MEILDTYRTPGGLDLRLEEHDGETVVESVVAPLPPIVVAESDAIGRLEAALMGLDEEVIELRKAMPAVYDDSTLKQQVERVRSDFIGHNHPTADHGHDVLDARIKHLQTSVEALSAERKAFEQVVGTVRERYDQLKDQVSNALDLVSETARQQTEEFRQAMLTANPPIYDDAEVKAAIARLDRSVDSHDHPLPDHGHEALRDWLLSIDAYILHARKEYESLTQSSTAQSVDIADLRGGLYDVRKTLTDRTSALEKAVADMPSVTPYNDAWIKGEITKLRKHEHEIPEHGHDALNMRLASLSASVDDVVAARAAQDTAVARVDARQRDLDATVVSNAALAFERLQGLNETMLRLLAEQKAESAAIIKELQVRVQMLEQAPPVHVHDQYLTEMPAHDHKQYATAKDFDAHLKAAEGARKLVLHQSTEETRGKERWVLEAI